MLHLKLRNKIVLFLKYLSYSVTPCFTNMQYSNVQQMLETKVFFILLQETVGTVHSSEYN